MRMRTRRMVPNPEAEERVERMKWYEVLLRTLCWLPVSILILIICIFSVILYTLGSMMWGALFCVLGVKVMDMAAGLLSAGDWLAVWLIGLRLDSIWFFAFADGIVRAHRRTPGPLATLRIQNGSPGDVIINMQPQLKPPLLQPMPSLSPGRAKDGFTFEELAVATNFFCEENLLGEGGFAKVYKGTLPNGKQVAIKKLKTNKESLEFQMEATIVGLVHHRHVVSLIGSCISEGNQLLVYEYVPNNTLERHLHEKGRPSLNWPSRLKIALGSAKGLAYLHENCQPRVIHRDIKSANILLDLTFEAKVADFGFAKHFNDDETHVTTRVIGTRGYLDPEYYSTGQLTHKSDVFSFGVVLLELITGCTPIAIMELIIGRKPMGLNDWFQVQPCIMQVLNDGNFDAFVDPRLGNNFNPVEMKNMLASAAACLHKASYRPQMSQVIRALEGFTSLEHPSEDIQMYSSTNEEVSSQSECTTN